MGKRRTVKELQAENQELIFQVDNLKGELQATFQLWQMALERWGRSMEREKNEGKMILTDRDMLFDWSHQAYLFIKHLGVTYVVPSAEETLNDAPDSVKGGNEPDPFVSELAADLGTTPEDLYLSAVESVGANL